VLVGLLLLGWSAPRLGAQTTYSTAATAAPLEAEGSSARGAAMAGAMVGLADDASAMSSNDAGLGTLDRGGLALHHNSWLMGLFQEQVDLALPCGAWGGVGVNLDYLSFGSFEGRDATGAATASYGGGRLGGGLHWGHGLGAGLYAGAGLEGFSETLAQSSFTSLSGDLGLLWESAKGSRLGVACRNLGGSVDGNPVAAPLCVGLSQAWDLGPRVHGVAAVEGALQSSDFSRFQAGLEARYAGMLALRAGYQRGFLPGAGAGLAGLSLGAGFTVKDWTLDYAFVPYGDLGSSQRISLERGFGAKPAPVAPRQAASDPVPAPPRPMPALPDLAPPPSGQVQPRPAPTPGAKVSVLNLQFSLPPDHATNAANFEAQGHLAEAVAEWQAALAETPGDAAAWRALGDLYWRAGRQDYATRCYESSLRWRPGQADLRQWLDARQAR